MVAGRRRMRIKQSTMDRYLVRGPEARWSQARRNPRLLMEDRSVLRALAEYEWTEQNVYVSRPRRTLAEEDVPYCRCEAGPSWRETCGPGCENRAMQVECVRGSCQTGGKCSNQRMQDTHYPLLSAKKLPEKGISLFADEDIEPGRMICQFTGEVVSRSAYRRRQQELKGPVDYYGMAVARNEVIDARDRGGFARFANHSCEPNCIVERWEVRGETCCGIVASTGISIGVEQQDAV